MAETFRVTDEILPEMDPKLRRRVEQAVNEMVRRTSSTVNLCGPTPPWTLKLCAPKPSGVIDTDAV